MHARMRGHIASTGSPRSQCSPAMIKSTVLSSPLWRGAAQRRGGQRIQESIATLPHTLSLVIASAAKQSSKLCTQANACDFIMTGSPRSQCSPAMIKSTVPSSPLWRGAAQRRGGQRIQESATPLSLRVKCN